MVSLSPGKTTGSVATESVESVIELQSMRPSGCCSTPPGVSATQTWTISPSRPSSASAASAFDSPSLSKSLSHKPL
eukprot:6216272-Prymnesium_polylepis.3